METVTEISGSQFLKKDHILTNLNDFLAIGNLFLFFQNKLLPVKAVYSSTGAYFSVNPSFPTSTNELFVYWKHYCFILRLFLLAETVFEIKGKSIFKDEPYSCYSTPIFFNFFRYFLKREPGFPYLSTSPLSGW